MKRLILSLAGVLGAILLAPTPYTATAAPSPAPSAQATAPSPLVGCAVKATSHTGDVTTTKCLEKTVAPQLISPHAQVLPGYGQACVYGNGPFNSAAWQSGWGGCLNTGSWPLGASINDQASSWAVGPCTSATFYANGVGTSPWVNVQNTSSGWIGSNFPLGNVPNDSVSAVVVWTIC
jgi:hypothetical protein